MVPITYKNLHKIAYPAYPIPTDNWDYVDGLLYLDGLLLDDKNQQGETLGARRMQTPFKDKFPLTKAAETSLAIIKQPGGFYIDNLGRMFKYEKTKMAKVKYYKIIKVVPKITNSILHLKGVNFPIKVKRPPPLRCTWAAVLHIDDVPWILYEYSEYKLPDTRRKI